jgi:hypothetical protein
MLGSVNLTPEAMVEHTTAIGGSLRRLCLFCTALLDPSLVIYYYSCLWSQSAEATARDLSRLVLEMFTSRR